jgi:putative nucleotidyltransferase with HDIG domain
MVLAELAALPAFRSLPEAERHVVFAGTLLHDISKPECTRVEDGGRVRSPGHAVKGVYKARRILTDEWPDIPFDVREQVLALVRWHGLPANYLDKPDPQRAVHRSRLSPPDGPAHGPRGGRPPRAGGGEG